jgi:hypothetical protein
MLDCWVECGKLRTLMLCVLRMLIAYQIHMEKRTKMFDS